MRAGPRIALNPLVVSTYDDFLFLVDFQPLGCIIEGKNKQWRLKMPNMQCDSCGESFPHVDVQEIGDELLCDDCFLGFEDDGQPSEYDEWQDYMGGDDWDHGQYDHCDW